MTHQTTQAPKEALTINDGAYDFDRHEALSDIRYYTRLVRRVRDAQQGKAPAYAASCLGGVKGWLITERHQAQRALERAVTPVCECGDCQECEERAAEAREENRAEAYAEHEEFMAERD